MRAARSMASEALLLKSVAFEDLGARVDSPGVCNDPLAVLGLQERSSDLTRPNDEVPQAIKLLNDYVHLSLPRRTRIPANTSLLLGNSDPHPRFRSTDRVLCNPSIKISRRRSIVRT